MTKKAIMTNVQSRNVPLASMIAFACNSSFVLRHSLNPPRRIIGHSSFPRSRFIFHTLNIPPEAFILVGHVTKSEHVFNPLDQLHFVDRLAQEIVGPGID